MSIESSAAIDHLIVVAEDLLNKMVATADLYAPATSAGWSSAAEIVQYYLAVLMKGRNANNPHLALCGATLLTTINKGVGNLEVSPEGRQVVEKALAVSQAAINAAKHLRSDVGIMV